MSSDFDTWYDAYPRKIGKVAARSKWDILARNKQLLPLDEMLAALERYKQTPVCRKAFMSRNFEYVCHPRTYLSQGRWEDVYGDDPIPEEVASVTTLADWVRRQHPSVMA